MPFSRSKAAVKHSQSTIISNNLLADPLEDYVSQYLLVLLCADMDIALRREVIEYVSHRTNKKIASYFEGNDQKIVTTLNYQSIKELAGYFGKTTKNKFVQLMNNENRRMEIYTQSVKARNEVAHSLGVRKTFREILDAIEAAEFIFNAFRQALNSR